MREPVHDCRLPQEDEAYAVSLLRQGRLQPCQKRLTALCSKDVGLLAGKRLRPVRRQQAALRLKSLNSEQS